jgi:hypothetical protein
LCSDEQLPDKRQLAMDDWHCGAFAEVPPAFGFDLPLSCRYSELM